MTTPSSGSGDSVVHPGDPGTVPGAAERSDPVQGQNERTGQRRRLVTVGELVQGGGNGAALGVFAYLVIGTAFWSLVGFLLDYLVGTRWIVLLGAGLGLAAGIVLVYLHLQAGLRTNDGPAAGHDARNRPADTHHVGSVGESRKDRH